MEDLTNKIKEIDTQIEAIKNEYVNCGIIPRNKQTELLNLQTLKTKLESKNKRVSAGSIYTPMLIQEKK